MNNFILIEDPVTRYDVEYIDDTLDDIYLLKLFMKKLGTALMIGKKEVI